MRKSQLVNFKKNQIQLHKNETQQVIDKNQKTRNNLNAQYHYKQLKRLTGVHWLIIISTNLCGIGLSLVVGVVVQKNNLWEPALWVSLSVSVILITIGMVLGFIKNQNAAKFYNNSRYRYRKTMEDSEAKICLWQKIVFLSSIPLVIFTIIATFI